MHEARQRQLGRPTAAADRGGPLPDEHALAGPRKLDRRGQPVRPRPDDDRVVAGYAPTPARSEDRFSRTISRAITSRWISFVPS